MKNSAIGIFCKLPIPGEVKTRLAAKTTDKFAKDVYSLLLNRLLIGLYEYSQQSGVDLYYFVTKGRREDFKKYLNSIFLKTIDSNAIKLQTGDNIGNRMLNAFDDLFSLGYKNMVLVGSDIVGNMVTNLDKAFFYLTKYDYVIGPAFDGGFYLIGASNVFDRSLFDDIQWSTDMVFQRLLNNLQRKKYPFGLLDKMLDIDNFDDLKKAVGLGLIEKDILNTVS